MSGKPKLLVVDDERGTLEAMARFLRRRFDVETASDGIQAAQLIARHDYDLVLTDLRMPGADGMSVLDETLKKEPRPLCLILSAYGTVESAVEAVKRGAFDFMVKPVNLERLSLLIDRALETRDLRSENRALKARLSQDDRNSGIVAQSRVMRDILSLVKQVAPSRSTVLLTGESGTGKEVMAQALHEWSGRTGRFVPVHCAALPATLLESELFGHEKGAFTGATEARKGRFELAEGGTLFLDEIGEIDLAIQVKLLRVLETRTFERLGGTETLKSDARIVAATDRELEKMVAEGTFREDLFYRLNVVNIKLPGLRDRREDIPMLIRRFLDVLAAENDRPMLKIAPDALAALERYSWPGNIRELRNCVERMVVLARSDTLELADVPENVRNGSVAAAGGDATAPELDLVGNERRLIEQALSAAHGNRTLAAQALGISRRTLHRRLNEYAASGHPID
ncbi:Regulatory protein AtoC [bioreactor metagenome]|uniref:Regulatory protein AtoC n=1 Tax=bioreactor metagenome TaxID=1076179 RepID=A0A644Y7A1_9ZZZZ